MLLTHNWSEEFNHMLIEDANGGYQHVADYIYDLGLLQLNNDEACDYKYDLS